MTFTKILCPTDFSDGARQARRVATRIAQETGAELVLVHAWYVPALAYSIEAPFPPEAIQGLVDDAQRELDAAVKETVAAGAERVTSKLLTGVPWMQIVEELERKPYDLCIIGTHGRTGLARVLLGSVAEKVVRHAPCSVLAVRPDGDVKPFHHALVPTDFSESAAYALDLAGSVVEPKGSVTLEHVIELPFAYSRETAIMAFARDLETQADEALNKELERFRRTSKLPIRGWSRTGSNPGAQTLALIEDDRSIDLVIMGSHGRTGIQRAIMGSVAEKVVRHARCPVLVARRRA